MLYTDVWHRTWSRRDGVCASHHLGLETQLNEMLTDRARGRGGAGWDVRLRVGVALTESWARGWRKTNRPSFPRCRKGLVGRVLGDR